MAHFEYSSVIQAKREDVFKFSTDITNLPQIMPPEYNLESTSHVEALTKGSEFEVRISRIGVSVLWNIVIEEFINSEMFRDRQSSGPFEFWIHTHKFEDHGDGTLMTDLIEYDLPYGLFGKLAEDLFVGRELVRVFKHRHLKTAELLGVRDGTQS